MTRHDRLIQIPARSRRATMGRALCLMVLLGAAPALQAQQVPAYGGGSYPAAYPQGYQQPVQRAQNTYYGNYQDNRIPGYIYPRTYPANNYG